MSDSEDEIPPLRPEKIDKRFPIPDPNTRPLVSLPLPEKFKLTPKEEKLYEKNKDLFKMRFKDYVKPSRSGVVVIYKESKEIQDAIWKMIDAKKWNDGSGRPKMTRIDEIEYKLDDMKKELDATDSLDTKKMIMRMMRQIVKDVPQLKALDDNYDEVVRQYWENQSMMGAEKETKQYLKDVETKRLRDIENERRRIESEAQQKRNEEYKKQRAKENAENEMMAQEDKPALIQQSRDAISRQYTYITDKLPSLIPMRNEYMVSSLSPLINLTIALLEALKNGVLVTNIEFIEELVRLVEMIPKEKEGNKLYVDKDDMPYYKDNLKSEDREYLQNRMIELNPEVQKLEAVLKALRSGKDNLFKGIEVNKMLKTPLYRSLDTNAVFYFGEKVKDIIRWRKEEFEEEKNKLKKKLQKLKIKYDKLKQDEPDNLEKIKKEKEAYSILYNEYKTKYDKPVEKAPPPKEEKEKSSPQALYDRLKAEEVRKAKAVSDRKAKEAEEKTGVGIEGGKLKGMVNEDKKRQEVMNYSNPKKALENAIKYLKKDVVFSLSTKPKKKYMVMNPDTMKWTHFGEIGYEDFLKHQDPIRQKNYLKRTANMKGNWKNDKFSANNLAREILWR